MMIILNILGILCLGYYLFLQIFKVDFAWVWLAAGVILLTMGLGGGWLESRSIELPFWVKGIILAVVISGLALFLFLEGLIFSQMRAKGEKNLDYVIVLGAQVKGDHPSRSLKKRILRAGEYLKENPGTKAILSGGQGPGENRTEAECMYTELVNMGIDKERLIQEDRSTSTMENLIFSARLAPVKECSTALITQDFHIYRSLQLARHLNYQHIQGIAASSEWIYQPHFLVREAFALVKEKMVGNI